jgi:hypothetical protein
LLVDIKIEILGSNRPKITNKYFKLKTVNLKHVILKQVLRGSMYHYVCARYLKKNSTLCVRSTISQHAICHLFIWLLLFDHTYTFFTRRVHVSHPLKSFLNCIQMSFDIKTQNSNRMQSSCSTSLLVPLLTCTFSTPNASLLLSLLSQEGREAMLGNLAPVNLSLPPPRNKWGVFHNVPTFLSLSTNIELRRKTTQIKLWHSGSISTDFQAEQEIAYFQRNSTLVLRRRQWNFPAMK